MLNSTEKDVDVNRHFSNEPTTGDLKGLSVRGGIATFAGQLAKFLLNLCSTVILARLLSPQDFGIIAMVTTLTGFIMIFKDMGLSMATVQQAEITHDQISTLFWINIAISVALMLITVLLAPVVAWFYNDPRLTSLTAVLSIAFIFSGLTAQHQALLRRQMRLSSVAIIDVLAMMVGILTALLCALNGLGYWSLVWMQVTTAATNLVGVWLASRWIPGRPVRKTGVRTMLAFGGYLTGFNFLNYFSRNLDQVLIGKFCDAQSLGLYSRAYSLLMFPIGQIVAPMTSVAVPSLSKLQNDNVLYRKYYLKALGLIAYLSFPLVFTLVMLSEEVVALVLGDQWMEVVPIFRVLAITAMFQPVVSTVGWIYISLGQTRRMAVWGVGSSILIMSSFFFGIQWGAFGVAASYAACQILLVIPCFTIAMAKSPLRFIDVLKTIYRPLYFCLCLGAGMVAARMLHPILNPFLFCIQAVICGCVTSLIGALLWPAVRKDLVGILAIFSLAIGRNGLRGNAKL